ncbi:transcription antitermination factor NusB [Capnocytophaga stomatis]|uniref:Transcription antitermination factor NusB n=1 Tax=Capnocytophaga stomatis TaxID=1848904 RepID=A0A250G2G0_9FLAO|nr:transcription antitermination factor NusB [Capnocytophaga stomatis]ATA90377.1 transcription antitermination factor NusB [Capnocytophaga stomatis]GIJ94172.1 N utilization substance protein B [Capnocytophaga stomatis]
MLTRRHIRVKVMQSIYAMTQSQSQSLDKELKFLQNSANDTFKLYLLTFSLLKELHNMAVTQFEVAQKKYLATTQDKNLNKKIIDNQVFILISNNELLQDAINNAQMNCWDLDSEYVKIIYKKIIESDIYKRYVSEKKSDFNTDRDFVVDVFKEIVAPNEKIYDYIEGFNLTWIDDFSIVNTFILKLLKNVKPDSNEKYFVPKLFKNDDDKLFATDLLKKVTLNDEKLQSYIHEKTINWDKDRIAVLDNIIIKMAICEFLKFPTIPVKVTLNEYLEIAKEYSTEKSSIFINGILDNLSKEFQERNELNKIGRGLL